MHTRLLDLMTLDRLVDLIGPDRLRALVERQLPVLELLGALGAKVDVDPAAVRHLLDALPASAPAPMTASAPAGEGRAYLDGIGALVGVETDSQPFEVPRVPGQQVYIGPNTLVKGGQTLGGVFVGLLDPTDPKPVHRERFVFSDRDAWLKGELAIKNEGAWPDWDETDKYAREARNAALTGGNPVPTHMATLDFTYDGLPSPSLAKGLEGSLPSGAERRWFKVDVAGLGKDKGRLLREILTVAKTTLVVDHWTLAPDYKPIQQGVTIGFDPQPDPAPTLEQFLTDAHALKHAWYVQTVYQILPV